MNKKKNIKKEAPKLVFCISDTHCGSDVALRPPVVTLSNGNENHIGQSLHHQLLWNWWQDGIEWIKKTADGRPFILLLNGDAIEGVHHGSAEVIAAYWDIHLQCAIECLKPIADMADTVLVVKGTECHTRDMENVLAVELGAEGGKAKDKWLFKVNGVLNDAAHHMGTTKRKWLESGDLGRLMTNAIANYAHNDQEVPKVYWRAHRHVGGHYSSNGYHALVCGAWQFLTRYGLKVVTESIPMPSIQMMDYTTPDELIHVEKTFNPPQDKITNI